MFEEMALNYFRNLSKRERKSMIKKLLGAMNEEEKLEVAKLLVRKK